VLVRYRSIGVLDATVSAQRRALTSCPLPLKVKVAPGEPVWAYPARIPAPDLLPGSFAERAVLVTYAAGHTSRRTLFEIYQSVGRISTFVQAGGPNVIAARAAVVHVAQESASNLG
jgi:hypothetical protein